MITRVTDTTGNRQDKIANAARVLGKSKDREKVFFAICRGKKRIKTVSDIWQLTQLKSRVRVLQEAKKLVDEEIIEQLEEKINGETCYKKINFYCKNRNQIINLARHPKKFKKFPTKTNPHSNNFSQNIFVRNSGNLIRIKNISIDDIASFSKAHKIRKTVLRIRAEAEVKRLFKKILGESGKFQDWGGEKNDLFSTRLMLDGKRLSVAFGLKGKGFPGKLTPKKMGKHGDQIQRLFDSPADVFIVQHIGEIDESILHQMKIHAIAKSVTENKKVYYGIIDGKDTERLFVAYG